MSVTLPPEIANPLKEALQQDAQPILNLALEGISGLGNLIVSKLPAGISPEANLASSVIIQLIGIALQGEMNVLLKHNSNLQGTHTPLPGPQV